MDGIAVALKSSEEAEGEETDGEADERHSDTHSCDNGEKKLVDTPVPLQRKRHTAFKNSAYMDTETGFILAIKTSAPNALSRDREQNLVT